MRQMTPEERVIHQRNNRWQAFWILMGLIGVRPIDVVRLRRCSLRARELDATTNRATESV